MKIKVNGNLKEYVKNIEKVEQILNKHDFNIIFIEKTNKDYKYILKINGFYFDYFEGLGNELLTKANKQYKLLNAFWCLLSDYNAVKLNDFYDFVCEFGYNQNAEALKQGNEVYNEIKRNNKRLETLFSNTEIDFLYKNIEL